MLRIALLVAAFFGLLSSGSQVCCQDGIWRPFLEMEGQTSSLRDAGQGNLFLPLRQNDESLLFADLRGMWTDARSAEGNWGLGYRQLLPSDWIVGAYGFYDLRHSELGNNFQQVTLGAELLSVNWGARLNGYIPDQSAELAPGLNAAIIQGNNIVVRRGEEQAYHGVDFEVESLLYGQGCRSPGDSNGLSGLLERLDAEVWAAAGVFHFGNSTSGFEDIAGPRIRTELRLYDLPTLGKDSRLVASGQYEHDNVRGDVFSGGLTVRIPFGPGGGRRRSRLSRINRRMVTPIVRDIDIITNAASVIEPAKVAHTGQAINRFVTTDANGDIVGDVLAAGANSVVIVDGTAGSIGTTGAVTLQEGQVLMGGGSQLAIIGANSGTSVLFTAPGTMPTVTHTANSAALTLARDTLVLGLELQGAGAGGGNIGVLGTGDLGNLAIDDNIIDNFGGTGISLTNLTGSGVTRIANNSVLQSGADGVRLGTAGNAMMSARIHGNVVENSALDGAQVTAFDGSHLDLEMTDNVFRQSGADAVRFDLQNDSVTSLQMDRNTMTGAASDGLEFDVENNANLTATISNNAVSDTTFGEGIEIDQDQNSVVQMRILSNTITNSFADPLDIDLDNNSSGFYQVANNQFTSPQAASIIDIDTNDNASLGLQMFGNTSNVNFDFDEDGTSTFQLEDTLGTNTLTGGATLVVDPLIEIVPASTIFPLPQQ